MFIIWIFFFKSVLHDRPRRGNNLNFEPTTLLFEFLNTYFFFLCCLLQFYLHVCLYLLLHVFFIFLTQIEIWISPQKNAFFSFSILLMEVNLHFRYCRLPRLLQLEAKIENFIQNKLMFSHTRARCAKEGFLLFHSYLNWVDGIISKIEIKLFVFFLSVSSCANFTLSHRIFSGLVFKHFKHESNYNCTKSACHRFYLFS